VPLSLHTGPEAVELLRDGWVELESRCVSHPFQTHAFAKAWSTTVCAAEHAQPAIVTLEDGDALTALFPANLVRYGPIRLLDWLAGPLLVDFGDVLYDAELASLTVADFIEQALALVQRSAPTAFVYLSNVRDDAIAHPALSAALREYKCSAAPVLRLDRTYDEIVSSLSPNNRRNCKRHERKLDAAGECRFEVVGAADPGFGELLGRLLELQRKRFDHRGSSHQLFEGCVGEFYAEYARRFEGVTLACLRLDGTAIAISYQCEYRDRLLVLVSAFDPEFSAFSPGIRLRGLLIRHGIERGLREIDMGWGEQPHKLFWTSDAVPLTTYVSAGASGRLLTAAARTRRRFHGEV